MGGGYWTTTSFANYTVSSKAVNLSTSGTIDGLDNAQIFKSYSLDSTMDPKNVIRECLDTEEHPNTKPVIVAIDVTGSMGQAGVEVASKLNTIMTDLYKEFTDIEFCVMGIGDLAYDHAPIQISQFESDVRIAEHLDKVWFEFGGGGNSYESYTAAWYMGCYHTKLDCWKRDQKGVIITIGDEMLNPYLSASVLSSKVGDPLQVDVGTKELYDVAKEKYEIYHIDVKHGGRWDNHMDKKKESFEGIIGDHYYQSNINAIADTIVEIVKRSFGGSGTANSGEISW